MFFKWKLNARLPWLWTVIAIAIGSTITMFSVQYLVLDTEHFMITTDEKLFLNALIIAIGYLFWLLVTNSLRLACIIGHLQMIVFGFIDYFVWQFRGNEFTVGDILGAGTGLSVASKYHFKLDEHAWTVLVVTLVYIFIVAGLKVRFRNSIGMRIIAALLMIVIGLTTAIWAWDFTTETWEQKGSYRNGYILNFCLGVRDCFVSEPEGYSIEEIERLEKTYAIADKEEDEKPVLADGKQPTIIAIMNESFADLTVIGDFKTTKKVFKYYDGMTENIVKGYALSSVYGAKTPNSEWEFLTGNTMAFLPDGAVVYQQFLKKEPNSLVATLKNEGYTAVAMHPYYATGWSRNQVYPQLGFDEMYFIDDFDQSQLLREYITDAEMYRKVIERFESKGSDEKLFLFGVTMQNHGGYATDYDNFDEQIKKVGLGYNDANQYLSLMYESDQALHSLIQYFEKVDEPVEIVFFGDHQPGLNSNFYSMLNGQGLSNLTMQQLEDLYTVPFFIWTNYKTESKKVDITSLNYLSTMTLERAGIELPPYNRFLADMMEEVPAINSRGYYSKETGEYKHIYDAMGSDDKWIRDYECLQYNNMFDKKNRSNLFFPYVTQKGTK